MAIQNLKIEKLGPILDSVEVVGGLNLKTYIATYMGDGMNISNIIESGRSAKPSPSNKSASYRLNNTLFTMNFDKWYDLVFWALSNPTLQEAKDVLAMTLGSTFLKAPAVSVNKFKDVQITPLIGSVIQENFDKKFASTGINNIGLNFGAGMGNKTVVIEVVNDNLTQNAVANVVLDAKGAAISAISLIGFVSGYFSIKSGTIFSQTAHATSLYSDIRLEDIVSFKYRSVRKTGA